MRANEHEGEEEWRVRDDVAESRAKATAASVVRSTEIATENVAYNRRNVVLNALAILLRTPDEDAWTEVTQKRL